ncbi:MAG: hypothetical protein A3B37_02220 [Candidatus Sungbacteria bacterium RIFCSPLOWO2_01_FULL_59_16]|uniref:DUF2914 domain-containing protein n=1 Tax=Candidatus Sungbacteria bacterium RIFCSPLOWO2_01_FULL_59_16 TaxID=1802280 RepID=A0A1G2LCL2_9BACT|nr:MAG: hypothetical protein A3B37_02220 [Candidatus Sungbacteria bacterium RIFCSPLOWO2_01_FULL_59_16]
MEKMMHWYERYMAPVAFMAGFALDVFTLLRTDALFDNVVLIAHLAVAGMGIVLINAYESGRIRGGAVERFAHLLPIPIQFSFGALFSGFTVLYARSGSLAGSGVFLGLLALVLLANEFSRERYRHVVVHLCIYFTALFAYLIFAVPLVTKTIGAGTFLVSGGASIAGIAIVIGGIAFIAPNRIAGYRRSLLFGIGGVYLLFHVLYFANIIPPIPLALKRLEVYHSVERTNGGGYLVTYEKPAWYEWLGITSAVFHWRRGTAIYAYSAVFSPADINTTIFHHWSRYDPESGEWIEESVIPFAIAGGRAEGYRGYTLKQAITTGKWRIEVRTGRGQLLGRRVFEVIEATEPPALDTRKF